MDLVIYTCSYGQINTNTVICINKLRHESKLEYEWTTTGSDALIGRGRSLACTEFLHKQNAPYMLFLDGDIVFTADDVQKIYDALNGGCDVVGGLYPVTDSRYLASHPGNHQVLEIDGGVHEIKHLATGFMGISRKILNQIVDNLELPLLPEGAGDDCYPFFESGARDGHLYISEDYDFCEKVRQAGGEVYAHTGVLVGHEKPHINYPQQAIQNTELIDPYLLPDANEYLGRELTIKELMKASFIVSDAFGKWEGKVEDFYKDNEDYLFDDIAFNISSSYKLRWYGLQQVKDSKVLDFGCGIGTMAIYLANQGNQVLGYDINQKATDFAKWRVAKHDLQNVEFTTEKPSCEGFDYILAIDVLEHFENLKEALCDLASTMKVGARLYHFDVFEKTDRCKQHFDHSQQIDSYITEAGLTKFNQFWAIKIGK